MDSNVYGIEEAVRQARRKLIEEWERKYSASLAHKYDTTSSLFATQEETLRERFRGVWKR